MKKTYVKSQQLLEICLLYTSDAADEEDSVDLGGRRIIEKKKKTIYAVSYTHNAADEEDRDDIV